MTTTHRISMNTSLKNAKIFDDDSWEAEQIYDKLTIKTESRDSFLDVMCDNAQFGRAEINIDDDSELVQSEFLRHTEKVIVSDVDSEECQAAESVQTNEAPAEIVVTEDMAAKVVVKKEVEDVVVKKEIEDVVVKKEIDDVIEKEVEHVVIKQEKEEEETGNYGREMEDVDAYIDRIKREVAEQENSYVQENEDIEAYLDRIQREVAAQYGRLEAGQCSDDDLSEDTSIKEEKSSFKSSKKSVFKRDTPYRRPGADLHSKFETDPIVLERRQKQIDFGKNTIGYDNYLKTIPKRTRSREDPATPNKHLKYSRRGWDGLIKQWRVRLHKYDPPEVEESK